VGDRRARRAVAGAEESAYFLEREHGASSGVPKIQTLSEKHQLHPCVNQHAEWCPRLTRHARWCR